MRKGTVASFPNCHIDEFTTPSVRSFLFALINLKRFFHRDILMHDRAHGFDHAHRGIGLKNISPHVDSDRAAFDRVVRQLQGFHLGSFFAAGDDDRNRTAADQLFEIVAVVSLDDMRAHFRGDTAGQSEIAHVARHIFADRGNGEHRDAVLLAFVDELGQADQRFLLEVGADKDRQCHRGDVKRMQSSIDTVMSSLDNSLRILVPPETLSTIGLSALASTEVRNTPRVSMIESACGIKGSMVFRGSSSPLVGPRK